MNEEALIRRYFNFDAGASGLLKGPGDDAALLRFPEGIGVISSDLFLQGAHFDPDTPPADCGYKALAVNLSDLAAMGARPVCFTLSLAMPSIDESWLARFSEGLQQLARRHQVLLVGGDLSRGALAVSITIVGVLEGEAAALTRDAAQTQDHICVTGTVGDAAFARRHPDSPTCAKRLHRPTARVELGQRLRGYAHAAIDVSDGALLDLQRLLEASNKGACVQLDKMPLSAEVAAEQAQTGDWFTTLGGGEDYELVFTVAPEKLLAVQQMAEALALPLAVIGQVEAEPNLRLTDRGQPVATPEHLGFDHFAT